MERDESKLNNGYYACMTCDVFDVCTLHAKNTSGSLYCTDYELKYGCEWVYRKTKDYLDED